MQTVISAATFGGANGILLPIGVLWLVRRPDLVPAMMLGTVLGLAIDAVILYRLFDTKLYPATGLWPAGVATAECIIAGDRGGKRAVLLGAGGLTGIAGHLVGIPMDNCGRLLDREHLGAHDARGRLSDPRLCTRYLWSCHRGPLRSARHHGRGGARALGQIVYVIRKRKPKQASEGVDERLGRTLVRGWLAFAMAASVMAAGAGLFAQMSVPSLIAFVVFAAVAALVSELIVGIAAMHSGWFPAFATALIFLVLGMAMGFEPLPLAFLVGFAASTGPAFADMGYDLKAGWILRGEGRRPAYEREGRRQQFAAELLGFGVAALTVLLFYQSYFERDLFPPVDRVFAATIEAGTSRGVARQLLLWAIPGALLQLLGGPSRQLGVLFVTGLLVFNPAAGWTAMAALAVRAFLVRRYRERAEGPCTSSLGGSSQGARSRASHRRRCGYGEAGPNSPLNARPVASSSLQPAQAAIVGAISTWRMVGIRTS